MTGSAMLVFATLLQGARQTQPTLAPSTLFQAFWLGALIVFVFSVVACGFTAKRINNISEASYTKAFLATFLKNLLSLTGFFIFGLFLQAPPVVAWAIAYSLIPIAIYKIVFASMWREALLIWFVALFVEVVVAAGLIFAGLVSVAPFVTGA